MVVVATLGRVGVLVVVLVFVLVVVGLRFVVLVVRVFVVRCCVLVSRRKVCGSRGVVSVVESRVEASGRVRGGKRCVRRL